MGSKFGDDGDDTLIDGDDDVIVDADGGDILLKDGGTTFGGLSNSSGNLKIKNGSTDVLTFSGANSYVEGNITFNGYMTNLPLSSETFVAGSSSATPRVPVTFVYTNDGSAAISLADGGSYPMRKLFFLGIGGNDCVITPANLGGASSVTLSTTADTVELLWIPSPGGTWSVLWSRIS